MDYFGSTQRIITPYRPGPGCYAKIKSKSEDGLIVGQWFNCRDLWHDQSRGARLFLYSHVTGKSRALAEFMHRFEEIVGVMPFSKFGPTQRKTITWIESSDFWKTSMRRSLLSLLLRVAPKYNAEKGNFYETLYGNDMTHASRRAIERFLAGHTTYKGRKYGWYSQFGELPLEQVVKLLE